MKIKDALNILVEYVESVPELKFAKDTLKRVFVFIVIALSAVGLNAIVELLKAGGVPTWITTPLSVGEYALIAADVLWFIRPLIQEIVEMIKAIFRGAPVLLTIAASLAIAVWAVSTYTSADVFFSVVKRVVSITQPAR